MRRSLFIVLFGLLLEYATAHADTFLIQIVRQEVTNNLVTGTISVNSIIMGRTYENEALKINEGVYTGYVRYISQAGHVQGPLGNMGDSGDFLLEVGQVKWSDGKNRENLLFHGGDKPNQSKGCVMLGPVPRDSAGNRFLPEEHALRKLRTAFYGTDNPILSPLKKIQIQISETPCLPIQGEWESTDKDRRFHLSIDQCLCKWTERNAQKQNLVRNAKVASLNAMYTIYRSNDEEVLDFLGFQPSLRKTILNRKPKDSFLILRREKDELVAAWNGLMAIKDKHARLSRLVQPGESPSKQYILKQKEN